MNTMLGGTIDGDEFILHQIARYIEKILSDWKTFLNECLDAIDI